MKKFIHLTIWFCHRNRERKIYMKDIKINEMENAIIYKTHPSYLYYPLRLFGISIPILILFHLIMGNSLMNSLIAVFNIDDFRVALAVLLIVFILMVFYIIEFTLTEKNISIKYTIRPFLKNYSFNLNDIDKITINDFGFGKAFPVFILRLKNNPHKVIRFSYISKKTEMQALAEHLKALGVNVEYNKS